MVQRRQWRNLCLGNYVSYFIQYALLKRESAHLLCCCMRYKKYTIHTFTRFKNRLHDLPFFSANVVLQLWHMFNTNVKAPMTLPIPNFSHNYNYALVHHTPISDSGLFSGTQSQNNCMWTNGRHNNTSEISILSSDFKITKCQEKMLLNVNIKCKY